MFLCPKCRSKMSLPTCSCGYTVPQQNFIWQFSDMPDMVTEGDGDKYVGYEHIGESYSGNRRYVIEEKDTLFAERVSELTGTGMLLDLACGDGCLTVPCAANKTKIIAGDISNKMLSILRQKADCHKISLDTVTLCRINALEIPLAAESVDTVVADSVLHLISNPQKVIAEIWRVLKKGGLFLCRDDRPGKRQKEANKCNDSANILSDDTNTLYNEIVNTLYSEYWNKLKEYGVFPTKYSWKFNRDAFCDDLFADKKIEIIERGNPYEIPLKDGLLPRFSARGYSDQVDVPKELHNKVLNILLTQFREKYGDGFENICYRGLEDDLVITIYTKAGTP